MTGTAAAQIIALTSTPFITRIYGPEAFGILGVFTAMISIVGPAAALTYPIAIVLPKEHNKAKDLIKLSLIISFIIAILTYSVLIFSKDTLVQFFNVESIEPYLFYIPLIVIFSAMLQTSEQWLIRMNQFSISAKATFYQAIIINGSKIGIGLMYPVASSLVIITMFGILLKSLIMSYFSMGKSLKFKKEDFFFNKLKLKLVARDHSDFPKFRAPQELLNASSQGLPILMLSAFFGPAAAGFYSIGRTVLGVPTQLIGKAVGDVFYPEISNARINGIKLRPLILKATLALLTVGVVPFGVIILLGPTLFEIAFGEDWRTAGEYARWLALWSYFMFANQPSIRSFPVLKAQGFHLFFTIISLILRLVALLVGFILFKSDIIAIILFSIISSIGNIYLILYAIRKASEFDLRSGAK
ncbi:oligosaccharide flippase family protein [Evansella sp. LMS18]|nr:oligosaccharide flippase family protein [Evansella sp. LMS18]